MANAPRQRRDGEMVGSRRLERLLRVRHQHPGQRSRADRTAPLRAQDAGSLVFANPSGSADAVLSTVYYVARPSAAQKTAATTSALCRRAPACRTCSLSFVVMLPIRSEPTIRSRPGRADLGVRPELLSDGGRLHRPDHPRSPARAAFGSLAGISSPHFNAARPPRIRDAAHRHGLFPSSWQTGSAACATSVTCRAA